MGVLNACVYIKIYKYLISSETNMNIYHPLEVVGRGKETQLQVCKK